MSLSLPLDFNINKMVAGPPVYATFLPLTDSDKQVGIAISNMK